MTNTIQDRVALCFANVFPDVPAGAVPTASAGSLGGWDSVAHITLLSAIAEEFGVEFEVEDYEELTSFPAIVKYLSARAETQVQ